MPTAPLIVALFCFAGVLAVLYPVAASWLSEFEQSKALDEYTAEAVTVSPADRSAVLRDAQLYNRQLFGSASVGAHERLPRADTALGTSDYLEQLRSDSNGLMGRVKIPAIDVDLPIYHGTSDEVLDKGVGHLEGTALPVGGAGTHAVLTAHRGLASAELFTRLDEVTIDDQLTIEVMGEVLVYRVIDTRVVEPDQTRTLYPATGDDLLTLVTCTPVGINSHRILVTAERVLPTPPEDIAASGQHAAGPGVPWWALTAGGSLVVLALYVRWAGTQEARLRGGTVVSGGPAETDRPPVQADEKVPVA
jgi:sortase A